ncbi:MAG: hypothetical protein ACYC0V_02830 [Armatimonadota bacterium]
MPHLLEGAVQVLEFSFLDFCREAVTKIVSADDARHPALLIRRLPPWVRRHQTVDRHPLRRFIETVVHLALTPLYGFNL